MSLDFSPRQQHAPVIRVNAPTDRAQLETAVQSWMRAFNAHDVEALIALSTSDVVLLNPEEAAPVSGSAATRKALQKAVAIDGELSTATLEVAVQGDFAWRIGLVQQQLRCGHWRRRGLALEIWKRVGEQWKLHRMAASIVAQPSVRPDHAAPVSRRGQAEWPRSMLGERRGLRME